MEHFIIYLTFIAYVLFLSINNNIIYEVGISYILDLGTLRFRGVEWLNWRHRVWVMWSGHFGSGWQGWAYAIWWWPTRFCYSLDSSLGVSPSNHGCWPIVSPVINSINSLIKYILRMRWVLHYFKGILYSLYFLKFYWNIITTSCTYLKYTIW